MFWLTPSRSHCWRKERGREGYWIEGCHETRVLWWRMWERLWSLLCYKNKCFPHLLLLRNTPLLSRCLIDSSRSRSGVELPLSASTKSLGFILKSLLMLALLQLLHVRCFIGCGAESLTKRLLLFLFFTYLTFLLKLCTTSCEELLKTTKLSLCNKTVSPCPYFLKDPYLRGGLMAPTSLSAFKAGASWVRAFFIVMV